MSPAILLLACSKPAEPKDLARGDAVGSSSQPLLGGTFFVEEAEKEDGRKVRACSSDDRAMFRQIMLLGRIVAQGQAMRECIELTMREGDDVFGPYTPCITDPHSYTSLEHQVRAVLDVIDSPHAVRITCTNGNVGVTRISGKYDLPRLLQEPFDIPNPPLDQLFEPSWLSDPGAFDEDLHRDDTDFAGRVSLIAPRSALVWHEAMHVHEYRHGCPNQTLFESVPYIVQHCLQEVAQQSVEVCDVRGGCDAGEHAILAHYPAGNSSSCECIRDAVGEPGPEQPATPRLDVDEGGDRFGAALAAGDFDADGFVDLAVGAPGEDGNTGRVFVYFGSILGLHASATLTQDSLDEDERGDEFGAALVAADLDGDGISELAVGAPGEDGARGEVYLFRGTRKGLVAAAALSGERARRVARSRYGHALVAGGSAAERRLVLAVSAPGEVGSAGRATGEVTLWGGAGAERLEPDLLATLRPREDERPQGSGFGWTMSFGPLSGTDQQALVVGAPFDARGGAVHVLRWNDLGDAASTPSLVPDYVVRPGSGGAEEFGASLSMGRLLGGPTLIVGAPAAPVDGQSAAGRVYLLKPTPAQAELVQTLNGINAGTRFGSMVTSHGRWSLFDRLLTASGGASGVPLFEVTAAFDGDALAHRALLRNGPASESVVRAAALGDFDGNGALDIALGSPDDSASNAGGSFRVWRRTDEGQLVPWGRHRQSD